MNIAEIEQRAEKMIEDLQGIIYEHGAGHESTVSYNDIKNIAAFCVDEIWKEMKSHDDLKSVNYFQYAELKSAILKC